MADEIADPEISPIDGPFRRRSRAIAAWTIDRMTGGRRRVLMIAFQFPPMKGSSGLQRTLNFARSLPALGWNPQLITVTPRAYPATSDDQMSELPDDMKIRRVWCLDAARHLGIRGRYPKLLAMPDRWINWVVAGVPVGLFLCARWKPDFIWCTFPVASAVVIGRCLASLSGIPLVLDLRDSMTEKEYPPDRKLRKLMRCIEASAVRQARAVVFTTPGAYRMYAERYPEISQAHWTVIPNGYDEGIFQTLERLPTQPRNRPAMSIHLVHSGLLDPVDRNPVPFFRAIADLKRSHAICAADLQITLRATGHDRHFAPLISDAGIDDIVRLAPAIDYSAALREMIDADGLIVFQASNCNHQIPAKIYEYLRAGKPLFAVSDRAGDTAVVLREAGFPDDYLAFIGDSVEIGRQFMRFLGDIRSGTAALPDPARVKTWSRASQAAILASLFDELSAG